MKLIIFTASSGWAGLSRIVSDISCRLPETVHQTIVLLEGGMRYPYRGRLRTLGENSRKHLPVRGLRMLLNAVKFRSILKQEDPDAVLVFHHDARAINFLAQVSLHASRCRTIAVILDVPTQYKRYFPGSRGRLHNLLISHILRHAHRIIATAEAVKSDIVSGYGVAPGKTDVIYAGVDSQKVAKMAEEAVDHPWFFENVPIIVSSGRFVFQKNLADLLAAFALVREKRPCRLVLIGDGEKREALKQTAANLGVADSVLFLGYQQNPFKFIARSRVFAFTSLFDAQPLAIMETMAAGCPIVAYDCPGGTREMLALGPRKSSDGIEEAEYGLLVPVGNVDLLSNAIMRLLEDQSLRARYSQLGRERARHFGIPEMAEEYFNVITAAVSSIRERSTHRTLVW